ncbi:MAG: hypothetical protein R2772_06680 [Chitinophagales bacterium]
MKKITIIATVITFMFISCNKENPFSNTDLEYESDATREYIDILTNTDRTLVISNGAGGNVEPVFSGTHYNEDVYYIFNGNEYRPDENGDFFVYSNDFTPYYGTTKEFSIFIDGVEHKKNVYVPKPLQINEEVLSPISKTGNMITWEKDENNKAGVLINYALKDNSSFCGEPLLEGSLITEDDGAFDFDKIIAKMPDTKVVDFYIQRGNLIPFKYNNRNITLMFLTADGFDCIDVK